MDWKMEAGIVESCLILFGEKSPKGDTDPNFWRKSPVLSKTSRQISLSFNFFGESDITGLSIGYTFNDPVQSCRR
jgi:hypothetical protein